MQLPGAVRAVIFVAFTLLNVAAPVAAGELLSLRWQTNDDELSVPLGAILDVAVDQQRVVYLLDSQNMQVRRFSISGDELEPLGRRGEGPGEFAHPRLIAARPEGGCIVLQDFHDPAKCLSPSRAPCVTPDVGVIRSRFLMTAFMVNARIDGAGRLVVAANTAARPENPTSPNAQLEHTMSVFRVDPNKETATVLFTDSESLADSRTVRFQPWIGFYALRCWDVDSAGRVVFADPDGAYRVHIGHPADGATKTLDLPVPREDVDAMQARASRTGRALHDLAHIADVQWIDQDHFLAKPMATVSGRLVETGGVIEVFDTRGASLGRHELTPDFHPESDMFYVRGGLLVMIRGNREMQLSSLQLQASTDEPHEGPIVIEVYDILH